MILSELKSADPKSVVALVAASVAFLIVYTVLRTIYSAFLGPLSRYPGPKFAAITRLPLAYHRCRGDADEWIAGLHARYGDVVRKSPYELSYANGEAWKSIYGHIMGPKTQSFEKDPRTFARPAGMVDIIVSNHSDHSRFRRNLSHAFSDRALRQQEPLLREHIDKFIQKLSERAGSPLDLVRWYNFTTFDIMGDLAFGTQIGNLDKGDYTDWVSFIFKSVRAGLFMSELNRWPLLRPILNKWFGKGLVEQRMAHWNRSFKEVDLRLQREAGGKNEKPDIWSFVLNAKDAQKMSINEMHANSQILMLAGTETTATLLSGLTWHLLVNPDKMAIAVKEVRETFNSAEEINIDTLLQLKYLNACFEEGLRCYPPVPTGFPRVIPKGGDLVCDQPVPEGTSVSVHQLSANKNPRNFARPTEFIPERWLEDPEFANDDRFAMQPFSHGPRNCIGKNLAYLEMRLILADVLWHFDVDLLEESRGWNQQKTYNLWEKNDLMVTLTPVVREK